MEKYTIEDLNALVEEFNKSAGRAELLEKIRELTQQLYLAKGDIPPNGFVALFNNAQSIEMKNLDIYTKNIVPLKECYASLQEGEQGLLNIVIFIFDILNGESKQGVVEFIKRTFLFDESSFNIHTRYAFNAIRYTLKIDAKEINSALNELLGKEYFFQLSFMQQKNIIKNSMIFPDYMALDKIFVLFEEAMNRNNIALQMQLYSMLSSLKNSDTLEIKSSDFYLKWAEKEGLSKIDSELSNEKRHIGIVVDTLVESDENRAILSLVASLQDYDFSLYTANVNDDNSELLVAQFIAAGCKVYSCSISFQREEFLEKALYLREKVLNDGVEYLIGTSRDIVSNFLFSIRSAKKQLFWSFDGSSTKIKNVEIQITHKMEYKNNHQLKIFTINEKDEFLIGTAEIKEQAEGIKKSFLAEMGKESVILGTIGDIQRIDNDVYMQDIAFIMKKNPHAIYFICGNGNISGIKQKIEKFAIDKNRFTFMDSFDKHLFGWVIDIYIDSSLAKNEHTIDEMINKQKPVVFYEEESQKFVEMVTELIEKKNEDYYVDFAHKQYKEWEDIRNQQSNFGDILKLL